MLSCISERASASSEALPCSAITDASARALAPNDQPSAEVSPSGLSAPTASNACTASCTVTLR